MNFFQKLVLKVFLFFYPMKVFNKENIIEGPSVVVCNHFRAIDCGFLKDTFDKNSYFLAKKEIFSNKIVKWFVKSYGAIPVDRDNPGIRSMIEACNVLKKGNKLVIFPEGTRNKTKSTKMLPLKGGSAILAVTAKCPIIPVMQLRKSRLFRKSYFIIGEPFYFTDFYDKKLSNDEKTLLDDMVKTKMEQLYIKLLESVPKKVAFKVIKNNKKC